MKKTFYIIILISLSGQFHGQSNLVPNWSFETYTSCPTSSGQLTLSIGWTNPVQCTSPDYYNSCSTVTGVPKAGGLGFQYAKTGNAYAGLWCYETNFPDIREYGQIQLISPLQLGKCYYIGFYTNLSNWSRLACNSQGAYISTNSFSTTCPTNILNYTSQIKSFNNQIIKDTLNWHLISGIFQSGGNEQFITIGNFNNNATTDSVTYNPSNGYGSYYYFDDVFVIPIDSMPGGMPAFAGNNVTINIGDSTFIGQQISNLNCTWYNGTVQIASNISGIYVQPTLTTTYIVQQNLCGNITNDTVVVTVNPFGTGVNSMQIKNSMVLISPNPNNGLVTIEILNKDIILQNLTIKIYDLFSRDIKKVRLLNKKQDLDLTELDSGIYYLQFFQDEKLLLTKKIIKQ